MLTYIFLASFPRALRAYIRARAGRMSDREARILWNIIDHASNPEPLWADLYAAYRKA